MTKKEQAAKAKRQLKKANAAVKQVDAKAALTALKASYPHVKRVVETGTRGNPTRVEISCTAGFDGCAETREIATQDAFQVSRCSPCQREFAKRARRKTPTEAPKAKAKSTAKPKRRGRRMKTRQTRLKQSASA